MIDRAKQFQPFDALKGFKEAIKEKERIVVDKKGLSEEDINRINDVLVCLKKGIMVSVIYYDNKEYVKTIGLISNIDSVNQTITVVKTKIKFNDILSIEII